VWSDSKKIVKRPSSFTSFQKLIKGLKIKKISRKGKNIIFYLSENYSLLIHQKLTGHLLYGQWEKVGRNWLAKGNSELNEKINSYIHFLFFLDNGKMIALSDLRKFAKIELGRAGEIEKELKAIAPDPLEMSFSEFKKRISGKRLKIKQVLMEQSVISGIGNIYSNEALFSAKINPFREANKLSVKELKKLYLAIRKILSLSIRLQGDSFSDYRLPSGKKGEFHKMVKVYRRQNKKCFYCGSVIKKGEIGGRSVYFCPKCQK